MRDETRRLGRIVCPAPEALERIVRALLAVGDCYAVLLREEVDPDPAKAERVVGPLRTVFARAIDQGRPARRPPVRGPV